MVQKSEVSPSILMGWEGGAAAQQCSLLCRSEVLGVCLHTFSSMLVPLVPAGLRSTPRKPSHCIERDDSVCWQGMMDAFVCPLTHRVMEDPVVAIDGYSYERSAFESWLSSGRRTSPATGLYLAVTSVVPNRALQRAIKEALPKLQPQLQESEVKYELEALAIVEDAIREESPVLKGGQEGWYDRDSDAVLAARINVVASSACLTVVVGHCMSNDVAAEAEGSMILLRSAMSCWCVGSPPDLWPVMCAAVMPQAARRHKRWWTCWTLCRRTACCPLGTPYWWRGVPCPRTRTTAAPHWCRCCEGI